MTVTSVAPAPSAMVAGVTARRRAVDASSLSRRLRVAGSTAIQGSDAVPRTVTVSSTAAVPSSAGVRVKVAVASVCRAGIVRVKSGAAAKPTTPASPEPLTATVTGRSSTSAPPATVAVTVTAVAPEPSESSECDSDSTTSGATISMPYCAAARLSLRLASRAAPAERSTVTVPEPAGVIVATYSV